MFPRRNRLARRTRKVQSRDGTELELRACFGPHLWVPKVVKLWLRHVVAKWSESGLPKNGPKKVVTRQGKLRNQRKLFSQKKDCSPGLALFFAL